MLSNSKFLDATLFTLQTEIPNLTPESMIFSFLESNHQSEMLINHTLLIFKLYMYNSRDFGSVRIHFVKLKITKLRA